MKKFTIGVLFGTLIGVGSLIAQQYTVEHTTVVPNFMNGVQIAGVNLAADGIATLASGETISNAVDGQFLFTRDTSGSVSIVAADDNTDAALVVRPGGATSFTLGGSSTTSTTFTTDDTGDGEIALRANSVGAGELAGTYQNVIFCGENAENGTTFFGPATAPLGGSWATPVNLASAGCDALDNTTEATADAPISTLATKVNGFRCVTDAVLGAGETIVFTLRTAAANAVTTDGAQTTLTCTIGEAATECRNVAGTTTNIVAGATLAMSVVETSNNTDDNAWCVATVSWP